MSGGDKILSENYFQHADHFTRVSNEQEILRRNKFDNNQVINQTKDQQKDKELEKSDKL